MDVRACVDLLGGLGAVLRRLGLVGGGALPADRRHGFVEKLALGRGLGSRDLLQVGTVFRLRHAGVFGRFEERGQPRVLLRLRDLRVGGHKPIKYAPHVVRDRRVQSGEVLVDLSQPALEAREGAG